MKLIDEGLTQLVPKSEMNGCGPKGMGWAVRDRFWKVNFERAANIHDSHYYLISVMYPYTANAHLLDRIYDTSIGFHRSLITKKSAIKYSNKVFHKNLQIINKTMSPTTIGYYARMPFVWAYGIGVRFCGKWFVK